MPSPRRRRARRVPSCLVVLAALLVVVAAASAPPSSSSSPSRLLLRARAQRGGGVGYATRIESGSRECYSEVIEAGATATLRFAVTDGGDATIDATLTATTSPPLPDWDAVTRLHYGAYQAGMRDRTVTRVLATWSRARAAAHAYTAPSAAATKHGLPAELTVCFDNNAAAAATTTPRWLQFGFDRQPAAAAAAATDARGGGNRTAVDAGDDVEAEMHERLRQHAHVLADVAASARRLRRGGAADHQHSRVLVHVVVGGVVVNVLTLATMATHQHYRLTRFLRRRRAARHGAAAVEQRVRVATA